MPGKLVIDIPMLKSIIKTETTNVAGDSYGFLSKVRSIYLRYLESARLEPLEKGLFQQAFAGLVLASGIIGYHFALHALKRLQEECGEIKGFDPLNSSIDYSTNAETLHEKPITKENLACFLVAYQHDCFVFAKKGPHVDRSKSTIRTGFLELVREQRDIQLQMCLEDLFIAEEPQRQRRKSYTAS